VYLSVPGALVLFQLVRWAFRLMAGCYALTSRQLLQRVPGPIPDPEPIELTTVASVAVEQSWGEWLLVVGRLRLTFEHDARPALILRPVGLPHRRAKLLEQAVTAAREGKVVATRAAA
jgi:hypothetical protein